MEKYKKYWRKQEILNTIAIIKAQLGEKLNDSQLDANITQIEQYITQVKYGLNYEKHCDEYEEKTVIDTYNLTELKDLAIDVNGNENSLIEGENLIALYLLKKTHLGKIDVIYADPPYNTGNTNLEYNDSDYIDENDDYSHSKWLSFMESRLRIAYDLLSPTGVLYVSIDETQIGCLILLCEQLFEESNIVVMVWPKMDPKYDHNRVEKPISNVKIAHEYVILCYKDKKNTQLNQISKRPNHSSFNAIEEKNYMESILFEMGTTSSAKDELSDIFGSRDIFATPKPRKLMKEFVRAAADQDAIILDYFAGSGTTGHAVMDLNKEDGGKRKFILVTNNENNICRKITYERLKRVIEKENYKENLTYFIINNTVS